eukprot:gene5843-biopygen9345
MSWGGTVNKGDDGKWHMHVAQFVKHCGFNQWATNSRVVHAVATEPDGQYSTFCTRKVPLPSLKEIRSRLEEIITLFPDALSAVADTVWPVWAHNPAVVRAPNGEWVMTFVANTTATFFEATCANGAVPVNSSINGHTEYQTNFMSVAKSLYGPWSTPQPIDEPFDDAVPPFVMKGLPNRNTNIIMSIGKDNSMVGLWRRCCSPTPKYR